MAEEKNEATHVLKVHHLRPAPGSKKAKTRVGRGEGSKGKTAGRGTKGTKARYQVPANFEGGQMPLQRRLPKFGFTNLKRVEFKAINLSTLEELAAKKSLTEVTVDTLIAAGFISSNDKVKILGNGTVTKALSVKAHAFSKSAEAAIVAAGGSVEKL